VTKAWPVRDIDPDKSLGANARRILSVRIAEFYSYAPIVHDESAVHELHQLRIAAKRLRYSLELFQVVFGEEGERLTEQVKEIQELLGLIHDHDVRIWLIEEELNVLAVEQNAELGASLAGTPSSRHAAITSAAFRPPPDDPRRGLLALLGRQYGSRHDVYVSFLELWKGNASHQMRADLVRLTMVTIDMDNGDDQ
jgi:hypothetical protein